MVEERSLKREGEDLAKVAVESGLGSKQLQMIYRMSRSKSMAFVEAFVQRQIGREIRGYSAFSMVLDLLAKYREDKSSFVKVLMYAVMLYDYFENEPTMKMRGLAEPIVKGVVEKRGLEFNRLKIGLRGNFVEFRVKLKRFFGNPKALALEIEKALRSKVAELSNMNVRVWIE
jgi:hypothetical protein